VLLAGFVGDQGLKIIAEHLGGDMANETYLDRIGRTTIIADIGTISRREGDDEFRKTRAQECLDTGKPSALLFDPHAERDLPLGEQRSQPATWIAPVQQQQIARREAVKLLKEHLPFAFTGAVKGRRQHEIGARQVQAEEDLVRARGSCQFDAGLGEGLLGELPRQLSLVLQVRKERKHPTVPPVTS
jgi:hypothetical protein